jgi:L-threonylcarbamoyladenylate synthase
LKKKSRAKLPEKSPGKVTAACIAKVLREGGVAVLPAGTVYGLFADATNKKAVNRIYRIKGREFNKPLQVFFPDMESVRKIAEINGRQEKYLKDKLPGPYTIILKLKENAAKKFHFLKGTIGVRIIKSAVLDRIFKALNSPLAATSANISGMPTPVSSGDIDRRIIKKSDIFFRSDKTISGKASSVIDLTDGIRLIRR